jgi:ABC-2 type transport system permease protein
MLATITTKTIADRWRGVIIGAFTVALFLVGGMAAYKSVDLSLYTSLPEGFRELFGISDSADAAGLAYGAIYGFYGALILAGLAVSMGSASIAGEERDGTIGVLLGNPKSRTEVLVSKAVSTLILTALAAVVLWAGALLAPVLLDVDVTGRLVGAQAFHIFANALFYGFLALAIGAWTGKPSLASGISAGVMALSFFAVGLLPLLDSLADVARIFPWYYLDNGQPLVNGIQWGGISLLLGGSALFAGIAYYGVNGRDLRLRSVAGSILDRLREDPRIGRIIERISGSVSVSRIWTKTAADHQALTAVSAFAMFSMMGVMMGPMYAAVDEQLATFGQDLPEALMALVGSADISTAEGWYQVETFSLMAPILVMAVTITIGAKALAGEEAQRTMGLLLGNPVRRSHIVLQKTLAAAILGALVGVSTFLGVAAGSLIAGLGMSLANIAATSALAVLIGLVFGGLALLLSALTGRVPVAVVGSVGVAFTTYLVNSLAPFSDSLAGLATWSPYHYYLTKDPLITGMPWGDAAILAAIAAALVVASVFAFDRRDLRNEG